MHKLSSNSDDREIVHILFELENNICDKKSELETIDAQLNKQQSDRIAEKLSENGNDFYRLSSSHKMRFEKDRIE